MEIQRTLRPSSSPTSYLRPSLIISLSLSLARFLFLVCSHYDGTGRIDRFWLRRRYLVHRMRFPPISYSSRDRLYILVGVNERQGGSFERSINYIRGVWIILDRMEAVWIVNGISVTLGLCSLSRNLS